MKTLIFPGRFSRDSVTFYEGLVVLSTFTPGDIETTVTKHLSRIVKEFAPQRLVIVPFGHLDKNLLDFPKAKILLNFLVQETKKIVPEVIVAPFWGQKAFVLDCPFPAEAYLRHSSERQAGKRFDSYARHYDTHIEETGHYAAQSAILTHIKEYIQGTVIDLACWPGFLAAEMQKLWQHTRIIANDLAPTMLSIAQTRLSWDDVFLTSHDALTLPEFIQGDTIICCNLLFYMSDKKQALEQRKTHLRPGGKLILIEENPFLISESKNEKVAEFFEDFGDIHSFSDPDTIKKTAHEAELSLVFETKVPIDSRHDLCAYVLG